MDVNQAKEKVAYILIEAFKRFRENNWQATMSDFAKAYGYHPATFNTWINKGRLPRGANIDRLASNFGPEIYDALEMPRRLPDDPVLQELIRAYYHSGQETKREVLRILWADPQVVPDKTVEELV